MALYKLKVVSKITNLPSDTIRNWEKRYSFLKPQVSNQGEKLYSDSDIELLKKITNLLKMGGRISEIANKVLNGEIESLNANDIKISNEVKLMIEDYYSFLLKVDLKKIDQIESLLEITVVFKNRIEFVYYPLLERIRQDSGLGIINKAQEHFSSYHLRHKIEGFLSMSIYNSDSTKKCSIVCVSPSSVIYESGLLILASSLKLRGYNIYYLGSHFPMSELIQFSRSLQPAIVAISIHHPQELNEIIRLFEKSEFPVCVGGMGVRLDEQNKSKIGAVELISYSGLQAIDRIEAINIEYFESFKKDV